MKGLREKVKSGEVSPAEALEFVGPNGSRSFIKWVRITGSHRYKQAVAEKEKVARAVREEEKVSHNKSSQKEKKSKKGKNKKKGKK